jgi:hypothetical protein
MQPDDASLKIIRLALFLNNLVKGSVSSIWIDKKVLKEVTDKMPKKLDMEEETFEINSKITLLMDQRRKTYLNALLQSLVYQIRLAKGEIEFNLNEFSKQCYGVNIDRAHDIEIRRLEVKLSEAEDKLRMTRFDVIQEDSVAKRSVVKLFQAKLDSARNKLDPQFPLPVGESMTVTGISRKPWSAFNRHAAAFSSELQINLDVRHTETDLLRLAGHEGYGGHHTELSLKDKLLLEGRGEHGLVITFSPQTFISEAIAESSASIFDLLPHNRKTQLLTDYDRLTDALLNLAAFWFFQDKIEKKEIKDKLMHFKIADETREMILNFATDDFWGKYALIYYPAYDFLLNFYNRTEDKHGFLAEIYNLPTTPEMITSRYS